jgi:hypothetical protein
MQSWNFLVFRRILEEFQRVNDLRQRPEKLLACALQIAKQVNYSPKAPQNDRPTQAEGPTGQGLSLEGDDLRNLRHLDLIGG